MVEFQGISWAGIPVQDFEAAIEFFRDKLGIPAARVNRDIQAAHFPLANGDLIEVFGPDAPGEERRSNVVVALDVDDIHQTRTDVDNAGVEILTEIDTWEDQAWFYFKGPDGLIFEIKSKG